MISQFSPQEQEIYHILEDLMQRRKRAWIFYTDKKKKNRADWRYTEPHLVGEHIDTGNLVLRAWYIPTRLQIESWNDSAGWRLYDLNNISEIKDTDWNDVIQFTRPGYNRYDEKIRTTYYNI